MKKVLVLWILVAIFAFGGITYLGFVIKKENEPYHQLEKALEKQAIALTGSIPSFLAGGKKLTFEDLNKNGYTVNRTVNGDFCDGYVLIEQSMSFYKYIPYIKCSKYTTHGYK